MAAGTEQLLRYIHRLFGHPGADPASDAALLERFAHQRDESAFNALIARHGPMVLGVCRRVLHDLQAAEDAFQATFLVLARKAATLRRPETLAAWLHGTARRLALKRRQTDERRRQRETRRHENLLPHNPADPLDEVTAREMLLILDQEMQRLPEVYRLPLILCYLEGRSQEEAARLLGWTPGSVKGRLERGRTRLHTRLVRRGLTLPASLLAGGTIAGGSSAARGALWIATSRAALAFAFGDGLKTSASVRALAEEALVGSTAGTVKFGLLFLLATVAGVGAVAYWIPRKPPEAREAANEWPKSRDEVEKATRTDRFGDPLPPGAIARLGTVRLRPGSQVLWLTFSPDGKRLASWTPSGFSSLRLPGRLSIWDTTTGRELRGFDVPEGSNDSLSWLKDGRCLALPSFGSNGPFVWDLTDQKTPLPSIIHRPVSGGIGFASSNQDDEHDRYYAIAPNGKLLAIGCVGLKDDHERPVYLRPLTAGRRIRDLQPLRRLGQQSGICETLFFTPDSQFLLVFSGRRQAKEDTLVVWEVATGKKRRQMTVPRALQQGGVSVCAVSPDGKTLAIGLPDGTARLWNLTSGRETRSLTVTTAKADAYQNGVSAVAFSPDGKHLITGGHDRAVRVWETASGREVRVLHGHHSWVEALAVSPDGKRIASAGQDGHIRIWDAATGADTRPLEGHQYYISGVAVSPDGACAVTSDGDGTVRSWDVNTGRPVRCIAMEDRLRGPFVFTPDGQNFLGSVAYRIHLRNAATGEAVALPRALADKPCGLLHFTADGKTLVTHYQGDVFVWEWPAGRLVRQFKVRSDVHASVKRSCSCLASSPDSSQLIVLSELSEEKGGQHLNDVRAVVELFDLARGGRPRPLYSSTEPWRRFCGAMFTPDGTGVMLAGGSGVPQKGSAERRAGAFRLLDLRTGQTRRTFPALAKGKTRETSVAFAVACSPDGRAVASVGKDSVLIFEVATGLPRRRLVGHRGEVLALTYTPDSKSLITTGLDTTGLVWDVSLAALAPSVNADSAQLWDDLASLKAESANRALATLAAAPHIAIPLLKERLRPADGPDAAALDHLVAELDSDRFAVRQKAFRELDRLGESVVFALRNRLDRGESVEVHQRIEQLLDKHDRGVPNPERVRELRALEILEQIGTPAARQVLGNLAKGAETNRLTREAKACLERIKK